MERPRCVVLGLDGLGLDLARMLAPRLPNLGSLVASAAHMEAELPELSPVNWTSFFTGVGPGEHGVFGFTRINPHDYSILIADSTCVRAPTIFSRLSERGLVSRVINLPNTYPAKPLNGSLVAGFVAPDLVRAAWPAALVPSLRAMDYRLEADTERGATDHDFLLAELRATLRSRRQLLDLFWAGLDFDLFVLVLTETDRIGHFLYPALVREDDPLHGPVMEVMAEWDALIGEFLSRYHDLPGPKRLLALADHGFAELITEVDLNCWLASLGHLRLGARPAGELDSRSITEATRAFALDPGRIYLHTRERFARGRLTTAEAVRLAEDLRAGLMALTWEGQPIMERVFLRQELYEGPMTPYAPDLVCLARPGFDLKAKFDRCDVFGHFGRRGCHTAHGLFHYDSDGVPAERTRDIGREVLRFFHCAGLHDGPDLVRPLDTILCKP